MHYVGAIGYRIQNGQHEMFIAESGWGASGWYPIDEFERMSNNGYIQDIYVIKQK